jgi:hypothetical protein
MGAASKSYSSEYKEGQFGKNLHWPDKQDMFDMLQMDILEYLPIAKSVPNNAATEFTTVTNIQSINTVYDVVDGAKKPRPRKKLNTILLPVPNDINYSDQLNWSTDQVNIIGKMLPALAGAAATGQGNIGELIGKLARGGTPEFLLNALSNLPGPYQVSAETLTQGIGGKVLNPYVEQIFKGIGMREFNFSWKLVPRNSNEQSKIHNIIKALRYYSLPNYSTAGVIDMSSDPAFQGFEDTVNLKDRWLTVPNIFKLTWKQAGTESLEIQSLPRIKPCVLKNIQVNYTPDNVWATHITTNGPGLSGPAPVAYNITITFSETEIITGHEVIPGSEGGY